MKRWLILLFLLFMPAPASAQTYQIQCPIYDTTVFSAVAVRAIVSCALSTNSTDSLFVAVTGETHCGSTSDVMMSMGAYAGPPFNPTPTTGASFMGSISAGVLTVTSMITPAGFNIGVGMTIFDAGSGGTGFIPGTGSGASNVGSTVTISSLGTGTGLTGTYNLSNSSFSVASEQMWAAPTCGSAQCVCGNSTCTSGGGAVITKVPIEMTECLGGRTYITTMTSSVQPTLWAAANVLTYINFMLVTESLQGNAPSSGSFNNGLMSILNPAPYTPPATGGIVQ